MSMIHIAGRAVGGDQPPLIVAELSGNHKGELARALALVQAAAAAGADAIKLQTYTADTITLDHDGPGFRIEGGLWHGRTLYDLYREAHTPWDWHQALFAEGKRLGLPVFSTPFDETAVDLLESLEAPAYKIASFELVDIPLIQRVAATGKPMILSTGMASSEEIEQAVAAARAAGAQELALLHCVSGYPAPAADYHLRLIPALAERFGVVAGLSDHSLGTATAVAAVALGAGIVEKHFTLSRAEGGPDAAFSLEPAELTALVEDCRTAWQAAGEARFGCRPSEQGSLIFRRSLYVVEDVPAGGELTRNRVRSIRPGFGLPPAALPQVLGRRVRAAVARGTPLSWALLE
jgi:N-acetylneuraminate synthase